MPTPMPKGMRLGVVAPVDAVAAFERRKLLQPSYRWQDVFQQEHQAGFAAAGVSRLDVLKIFQDEIDQQLQAGGTLGAFAKSIRPQLQAKGFWGDVEVKDPATGETRISTFDDARLRLIFDVNVRQSQAVGTWERSERTKALKPFLLYRTMGDERVRVSHRPWDYIALPREHPWWDTHYPPNGWRCRCYAYAVSEADIQRLIAAGRTVLREAPPIDWIPYVNPRTGEVVPVPRGIDPGFAYNPGKARDAGQYEQALRKALEARPLAGAVAVAQASTANPAALAQTVIQFGLFVDDVLNAPGPLRSVFYVGALRPQVVRAIEGAGVELDSAALAVTDDGVKHTLRPSKVADGVAVTPEIYKRLPELLVSPSAVLLERATNTVLYVLDVPESGGRVVKVVVQLQQGVKLRTSAGGERKRFKANVIRTATVMDPLALSDQTKYSTLWGRP